ncbi:MAG: hypothetical protein K2X66_09720 [Cyanobacteria bacterium]|nr:hypothetical protein [Cyanobacteriota bacterium]
MKVNAYCGSTSTVEFGARFKLSGPTEKQKNLITGSSLAGAGVGMLGTEATVVAHSGSPNPIGVVFGFLNAWFGYDWLKRSDNLPGGRPKPPVR